VAGLSLTILMDIVIMSRGHKTYREAIDAAMEKFPWPTRTQMNVGNRTVDVTWAVTSTTSSE